MMMDKVENAVLNFLYKAENTTVEALTLMLAQTFRHPFSHYEVLGIIDGLHQQGLIANLLTHPTPSSWPALQLTEKGERVTEEGYGELWDDAAYRLWLESSAN